MVVIKGGLTDNCVAVTDKKKGARFVERPDSNTEVRQKHGLLP